MGCDIHAHTEVKINGQWHHYAALYIDRNYDLFGRMADVRTREDIKPISKPRGVPDDISFLTRFDMERWGRDGHSHSWLSGEEIESLTEWHKNLPYRDTSTREDDYFWVNRHFGFLFGNGWDVKKYPGSQPIGVEDSRVVFWFDN